MAHRFEWTVRPQILAGRAEHSQCHSPARFHRTPHICEGGRRIAEEHDPEAREREFKAIMFEGMAGNVGHDHLGVPQPGGGDPFARPGHGLVGDICAKDVTARSDAGRQLEHCRAAAATEVEHVLAGLGSGHIQQRLRQIGNRPIHPLVLVGPGPRGGAVPKFNLGSIR